MSTAPPDVFVNYYELLGLPPTADTDTIEKKIKGDVRAWRKRTESSNLATRQEAELRMQHLQAARETLLDPGRRAAYDKRLATAPPSAPRPTAPTGTRDWLSQAEEYLAMNDYHSAAYAAREATRVAGDSPRAWNVRGRANAGLGNLNDALYEVRQATALDPNNTQYHFDLGTVCEQLERWQDALAAYETAARLDPSDHVFRLAVAGVYVQNDLPEKALPIVEEVHRRLPDDELVNNVLAETLSAAAEAVPAYRESGGIYMITSPGEITRMEALLDRAAGLQHLDRAVRDEISRVREYVDGCAKKKYSVPEFLARRWDNQFLGWATPVIAPLLTFIFMIVAFGQSTGAGMFMLMVFIGVTGGLYVLCWVPQWKANKRLLRERGIRV